MKKPQLHGFHGRRSALLSPASRAMGLLCLLSVFVVATSITTSLLDSSLLPLTAEEKSFCGKKLTVAACKMKMGLCGPLDTLLAPLMGTPQAILSCANTSAIPLKADFYSYLGKAMMKGAVGLTLPKKPTGEPLVDLAIRKCILSSTGLLGDDLQLNRTTIAAQLASVSPPSLAAAVGLAVNTCPEPLELKMEEYIKCLKKSCMASIPDPTPSPAVGFS
ncbi:uncharacterized protein LOC123517685 [Portunus trituberculatus]|uniref:uncharacterized protein LOC123517685 n=1 Tax=Portunus trituberculatus TaxID=210409 RepID=UPI001E1D0DF8|nr:uncharacterized protein LOC123517685 [Portunus trituberculatus]XP_045133957.1 uncharacterized protein LOC123517685 [Portunus trituberculatus]XP_045133958.1 uncharacterized protein LOC123517685 [Portunus trituberculatus]